jgi:uncharacterized protein
MAFDLLDVNVWLALANPAHTHHAAAKTYWLNAQAPMAFCRTSMQGFLRLVTQPAVMGVATHTPAEAWSIYSAHLATGRVQFLAEPTTIEIQLRTFALREGFHNRDWTDAYLASFAITSGCRMVSFDKDFSQYERLQFLQLVA